MHHDSHRELDSLSDHDLLVEMVVKMRDLAGNGKPGRMDQAEKRLSRLERWQAGITAVITAGAFVIGLYWRH